MPSKIKTKVVLAGDIGGTKTNLGLFREGKTRPVAVAEGSFVSTDAAGLEEIIDHFIHTRTCTVAGACFGIAGPVIKGTCKTTNFSWVVSEKKIQRHFGWPHVRLVNDMTALGESLTLLHGKELLTLNKAKPRKGQHKVLLAPGTGLGVGTVIRHGAKDLPIPSEGGHVDFAPTTRQEAALLEYLTEKFGHVSVERVASGMGMLNIYEFLKKQGRYREPAKLRKRMEEGDPGQAITEGAMKEKIPICKETLKIFLHVLGSAAGNLSLTVLAHGGVYLGGGIPPKILPALKDGTFLKAFLAKGRFKALLSRMPVHVILNEKAGLMGAARLAFEDRGVFY